MRYQTSGHEDNCRYLRRPIRRRPPGARGVVRVGVLAAGQVASEAGAVERSCKMTIRQKVTRYEDVITFGKYKGKTIEWIAENDPSYIVWLNDEQIVDFPDEIVDAAIMDDMNNNPPEEWFWQPDQRANKTCT